MVVKQIQSFKNRVTKMESMSKKFKKLFDDVLCQSEIFQYRYPYVYDRLDSLKAR